MISWSYVDRAKNEFLDKNGYYALLGGRKSASNDWTEVTLLYVGKAFDKTIRQRLKEPHESYACINKWLEDHSGFFLLVMGGWITRTNVQRLTPELEADAECCLIFSNQPKCNTICKDSYRGRSVQVANTGDYSPLTESSHCQ